MKTTLFASCLVGFALAGTEDHWAVLIAGGQGYTESYKWQSDVAQAYRVLQFAHMQDANNIYMAYNDIAHNDLNPQKGFVYNWPTSRNGWNQVQFDYEGDNVTREKFLAVLKGDAAAAGGPVLGSNENSNVFIFYSGPASVEGQADMPTGDPVTEDDLMDAINHMSDNKMFK